MLFSAIVMVLYILFLLPVLNAYPDCHKSKQFLCGDVCVDYGHLCQCGKVEIRGYSTTSQRTERFKEENLRSKEQESYCCGQGCFYLSGIGICTKGTPKKLSEKCSGKCFLDYKDPNKTELDFQSRYECDNGHCVPARYLCKGAAACSDRSGSRYSVRHYFGLNLS